MTVEIDKRGAPWAPLLTMKRLRPTLLVTLVP